LPIADRRFSISLQPEKNFGFEQIGNRQSAIENALGV